MKKQIYLMMLIVLFANVPAFSTPKLPMSADLSGMQGPLKVIRHVSLRQAALKSRQSMLDIMEIKNQMDIPKQNPQRVKASVLTAPIPPRHEKFQSQRTPQGAFK